MTLGVAASCTLPPPPEPAAELDEGVTTTASMAIQLPDYCDWFQRYAPPLEKTYSYQQCFADIQFSRDGQTLYAEDKVHLMAVDLDLSTAPSFGWVDVDSSLAEEIGARNFGRQRLVRRAALREPFASEFDQRTDIRGPAHALVSMSDSEETEEGWFGPVAMSDTGALSVWLRRPQGDEGAANGDLIEAGIYEGDTLRGSFVAAIDQAGPGAAWQVTFSADGQAVFARTGDEALIYEIAEDRKHIEPCPNMRSVRGEQVPTGCLVHLQETWCAHCRAPGWTVERQALSDNGRRLVLEYQRDEARWPRRLRLMESDGETIRIVPFEPDAPGPSRVVDIAISPDGQRYAVNSTGGTVFVFDEAELSLIEAGDIAEEEAGEAP